MRSTRLLLVVLCVMVAPLAWAGDDLPILVYPCPKAETAPVIDGSLDDACWGNAPSAGGGFTYFGSSELVPVQTFFRVTYDDTAVYFAITCDEPKPEKASRISVARDSHEIFGHEAVEIFLDPNHTHSKYHQLGINAAGSLYDTGPGLGTTWNGSISVATDLGADAWYVEVAVPWADIGVEPKPGQVHGFNVCRDRYLGPDRQWGNWARVMGTFHDYVRFAHLVLSPTEEQLGKLGAEFRKGDRSGPIQIFTTEGFAGQSYRLLLKATLERLEARITEGLRIAEAEPDPAARRGIEGKLQEVAAEVDKAHETLTGEALDAESFTRLDMRLNELRAGLSELIWEARLQALLSQI